MSESIPAGYYRDHQGELQRERRNISSDRRKSRDSFSDGERRNLKRRKSDSHLQDREHSQMIEEALDEFSVDHPK